MGSYALEVVASDANFDESGYLAANPDVARAVAAGAMPSALVHFQRFGAREGRRLRLPRTRAFLDAKARKLARIEPLLRPGEACVRTAGFFDCLTDDLRRQFQIVEGGAESSNEYDGEAMALFDRHADGLVLDVGAGRRSTYFDNVVNFEIAPFDSTDVRGVAERLPFADASFDAAVSIAVLEHVRDPFAAAAEIVRVLKPGGELLCCVPFLQPLHGFPHHYYNMTHTGLRNLFEPAIDVERVTTPDSTLPIFSLTWILRSWADGLAAPARQEFLSLKVGDLLGAPVSYLGRSWVRGLSEAKNLELASACVLHGRKRDER